MRRKIYRINEGVIEVYKFEPKYYKMNLFRLEELKKIQKEKQILRREATRSWFTPKKRVVYECENYILREFDFSKLSEMDLQRMLSKFYINGKYRHDPVSVQGGLILLHPNQGQGEYRIQLTEDAYLGYLLENERFDSDAFEKSDLERQRDLFEISEDAIAKIPIEGLDEVFSSELVDGSLQDTLEYVDKSNKVFQKLK